MNIIIAGDGRVGSTLARELSAEGYDLTLIDSDPHILESSVSRYDVMTVAGNCASMPTLRQAGVMDADLLIAVTSADEVNLLCCTTAHALNPKLHTIARIRNPEYIHQIYDMQDTFGLSMGINPEKQAAREMERLLKFPGFLRREVFAKGRTEIVELKVDAESKLRDARLMDLGSIVKCRILVCAVLREGTSMVPSGNFVLREGDRVFVTAPTENLAILLKNLGILTRRVRRVMFCGGDRVSYYLAELLKNSGIQVRIIEADEARCRELFAMLPDAEIIHADVSDPEVLEDAGLGNCDAMVTLTEMDQLNMILSLHAIARGIPQVITKMSQVDNRTLIDSLNLGSVICPKELCCNDILRYVRAMQNQTGAAPSVHAAADGQVEALEFPVDANTKFCGVPLKKLKLKPNVLIASISRGAHTEIPNGESMFAQGDTLVVVTSGRGVLKQINDIFQ